jgi:hypothetical protein
VLLWLEFVSKSIRVGICALTLAPAIAIGMSVWPSAAGRTRTEDTNHDGRPDVWRYYDARGELAHITIDSNFDGYPDREEEYRDGSLVRRESDRNFDQRVDLIEEFDPSTHQHLKSTVDADFDGRADLLVLFQDGQPVYSEWSKPSVGSQQAAAADESASAGGLVALLDPFSRSASLYRPRPPRAAAALGITIAGLAIVRPELFRWAPPHREIASLAVGFSVSVVFSLASPRAPPLLTT